MNAQANGRTDGLTAVPCAPEEYVTLERALGESPETVIPISMLRSGKVRAYRVGPVEAPQAIAVQSSEFPEEPTLFGSTAEAVAALVSVLEGWTCVNVARRFADRLIAYVEIEAGAPNVRTMDDVYHQLDDPAPVADPGVARLLVLEDEPLIRAGPSILGGDNADDVLETIRTGHVAGAIVDGKLVSLAHTFAISDRFADIGVATDEAYRRRGYSTAAAALVCDAIQRDGRTPVWSCGGANAASLRVAAKLGFRETSRRIYLIPAFNDLQ